MSLVPTWVKAVDGKYYKNPNVYGAGWYVCFDDDDPPEFVMEQLHGETKQDLYKRALALLPNFGQHLSTQCQISGRLYPPDFKKFKNSASFFFVLKGPISVPEKHEGVCDSFPKGECCIYSGE